MDAYSQFYTANKDRLYAYLLRMTGETQLAVDLVQESFARYLGRYGRRNGNRALLYTIARNAALDAIRRCKADPCDMADCEDPGDSPEQQVIHRQALARMQAALAKLPIPDRELIALVAAAELPYREIAGLLDISEANVKVRVHRIRMRLRTLMEES